MSSTRVAVPVVSRAGGLYTVRTFTFGLHGLGHGHPDKLNVVTSAFGVMFGLDPGSINYGAPLHSEWYRSTIAHNTVCVDQQLQANHDGDLVQWTTNGGRTLFEGTAKRVYDGVSLTRRLELNGAEIIDTFERTSGSEHQYDWAFHAIGKLETSLQLQPSQPGVPGNTNGYQDIHNAQEASPAEDWWARWGNQGRLLSSYQGAAGTTVLIGQAPGRTADERIPLIIVRRKTDATVFTARHVYSKKT